MKIATAFLSALSELQGSRVVFLLACSILGNPEPAGHATDLVYLAPPLCVTSRQVLLE